MSSCLNTQWQKLRPLYLNYDFDPLEQGVQNIINFSFFICNNLPESIDDMLNRNLLHWLWSRHFKFGNWRSTCQGLFLKWLTVQSFKFKWFLSCEKVGIFDTGTSNFLCNTSVTLSLVWRGKIFYMHDNFFVYRKLELKNKQTAIQLEKLHYYYICQNS